VQGWIVGLGANAVIAVAYVGIVGFIVVPLVRSRQLTKNKLGVATAAIFLTCAVHRTVLALHLAVPSFSTDEQQALALRQAWGWDLAVPDLLGAAVAAYYFGLRRIYGSLMQGAQLFDDLRRRERTALEINDNVLQGLVVAKMALELDQQETAVAALDTSIAAASRMISSLLDTEERPVAAGLLRTHPAVLEPTPVDSAPVRHS
jgi:signal transduction histidine kinase